MLTTNVIIDEDNFLSFIDERIISRLTEALVFNLSITNGMELVSSIGNGDEADNKDAIKTWVTNQQINIEDFDAAETLSQLENKLVDKINELKTR